MSMTTGEAPIVTWPESERAVFLKELADQVARELGSSHQPYTRAANALVPQIASALCADPAGLFTELVETTQALAGFNSHPRWDREADAAEGKVDRLVTALLGGA